MKKEWKQLILLGISLLIFGILMIFRNVSSLSDFYVRYISGTYFMIENILFSFLPWTIYEFTLVFLVLFILDLLIKIIVNLCKRRGRVALQRGLTLLLFICFCVNYYTATASISYGRSDVKLPLYQEEVTQELIDESFQYYLNDFNRISKTFEYDEEGFLIAPYTFEQTNDLLKEEFKKLDLSYYYPHTGKVKKLVFSNIFTELHFTGITWAPSGEITVNADCHASELPHTMAHEIAHSKGVYREDDANLVGLYACLISENDYLRYAAYKASIFSLLDIYRLTNYEMYIKAYFSLDERIRLDFNALNKFWSEHDILSRIGEWYNDIFLKANGNENGTDDYNDDSSHTDTGEVDENQHPIYVIDEYSPYQKLLFSHYLKLKGSLN